MQDHNVRSLNDMGSAANKLTPFSGEETEVTNEWLRDARFVAKISGLTEVETYRQILLASKGKALSWESRCFENVYMPSLHDISTGLVQRFDNQQTTNEILNRFLHSSNPLSRKDYLNLLSDDNMIYERECLNLSSLIKTLISKVPMEI